jgi:uncharacterized membrane protein HdeD (DUF308 family)
MLNFPLSRGQAAARGLLALILGVVFIVWPGISIGTAVVLFAIYCLMDAGIQIGNLFAAGASAGTRVLRLLLGCWTSPRPRSRSSTRGRPPACS